MGSETGLDLGRLPDGRARTPGRDVRLGLGRARCSGSSPASSVSEADGPGSAPLLCVSDASPLVQEKQGTEKERERSGLLWPG